MSSVVRVPENVHLESKRLAALTGAQPGELLAEAWAEYVQNHKDRFVKDLEEAANLLRNGTLDELAAFAGRGSRERARLAAERIRQP